MTADSIGAQLRRFRRTAGSTLEELAEASGVSVRAISNMERGQSQRPHRRTVEALADALGVSDDDRQVFLAANRSERRGVLKTSPAHLELPRVVGDFTGRLAQFRALELRAEQAQAQHATGVVAVVCGQPGVGKTSFAVQVANELADRFPDGPFFVDLRGLDDRPVDPAVVLERLIRALGFDEHEIPRELSERAALFRATIASRRVVLVLDNAAGEQQVRPLLPAALLQHPNRAMALPIDAVKSLSAVTLSPGHPVADLAAAYFQKLASRPDIFDQPGAEAVGRPSIELVRALISIHLDATPFARQSLAATHELRILEYVRAHLSDPALSAAQIAGAHQISVRHLYNLLARTGISLGDWIRTQRLEESRSQLARPAAGRETIAAIAHRCGFVDASSFGRLFRSTYGLSPREWRATNERLRRSVPLTPGE